MGDVKRLLLLLTALVACNRTDTEPKPDPAVSNTPRGVTSPLVIARGVRIDLAPSGDVDTVVKEARARELRDGRKLVVYVGAVWCEPCQHFHKAAAAGKLDADFPALTLLEFDLDKDKERLDKAGYASELIPLFVKPNVDGRASPRRFEGSIKGDGAVANITPRLRELLAD